jgi:hypothetical protein
MDKIFWSTNLLALKRPFESIVLSPTKEAQRQVPIVNITRHQDKAYPKDESYPLHTYGPNLLTVLYVYPYRSPDSLTLLG